MSVYVRTLSRKCPRQPRNIFVVLDSSDQDHRIWHFSLYKHYLFLRQRKDKTQHVHRPGS
jgi:hypothetical protein